MQSELKKKKKEQRSISRLSWKNQEGPSLEVASEKTSPVGAACTGCKLWVGVNNVGEDVAKTPAQTKAWRKEVWPQRGGGAGMMTPWL